MPDPDPGKSLGSGRIQIPLFLSPDHHETDSKLLQAELYFVYNR